MKRSSQCLFSFSVSFLKLYQGTQLDSGFEGVVFARNSNGIRSMGCGGECGKYVVGYGDIVGWVDSDSIHAVLFHSPNYNHGPEEKEEATSTSTSDQARTYLYQPIAKC